MKKNLLCIALLAASNVNAEPTFIPAPNVKAGVLSSRITTTELSDADVKRLSVKGINMTATADVFAAATDLRLRRGERGTARSSHSVCFETLLTTEADYTFTLNVGGYPNTMKDHIVIAAHKRTCVEHELYQDVNFSSPGLYSYYAITTGTTMMAGTKRAENRGTISVYQ